MARQKIIPTKTDCKKYFDKLADALRKLETNGQKKTFFTEDIEFFGDTVQGSALFCACDSTYFQQFAKPLAYSANAHGNDLHIHVIGATNKDRADFVLLKEDLNIKLSISEETGGPTTKEYYACNRFLIAPFLLEHGADQLIILDADCLVMKHIEFPDADFGLFLRNPYPGKPWVRLGTHVAAGMVFCTKKGLSFAETVSKSIRKMKRLVWFADQVALWKAYKRAAMRGDRFHQFTNKDLDWEFIEGTSVWTGKGPRKYENPEFLKKQQYYRDMWNRVDDRFWIKS